MLRAITRPGDAAGRLDRRSTGLEPGVVTAIEEGTSALFQRSDGTEKPN